MLLLAILLEVSIDIKVLVLVQNKAQKAKCKPIANRQQLRRSTSVLEGTIVQNAMLVL